MRGLILVLAWITPAFVAGLLGWSGIWGGSSAVSDFLIPIPVAGGALHVPSFVVATAFILGLRRTNEPQGGMVLFAAASVFLAALTLQIDFDGLSEALFTDYEPAGSALRLEGNPVALFVTTDAFWVAVYAFWARCRLTTAGLGALTLVPATIIAAKLFTYSVGTPRLTYGFRAPTQERGNEIAFVHTPGSYDEALFRGWLDETGIVTMPWETPNAENLAVYFTNSMQAIRWGDRDAIEAVVGTLCFHEADRSSTAHPGHHDCFAGRLTLHKLLSASRAETDTGFGAEVDKWYALARLCEGIEIPDDYVADVELVNFCRGMKKRYAEFLAGVVTRYGAGSPEVRFVEENAASIGIPGSANRIQP